MRSPHSHHPFPGWFACMLYCSHIEPLRFRPTLDWAERQTLNKLFARELSQDQGQPASWWLQLHRLPLAGLGAGFPHHVLDVESLLHMEGHGFKHPVGGLNRAISRNLVHSDDGVFDHRTHLLSRE